MLESTGCRDGSSGELKVKNPAGSHLSRKSGARE